MKQHINFKQFIKDWAKSRNWIPVYVYADEDFSEKGYVCILMDMVVPERLLDGNIMVLSVKMEEKDLPEFRAYMAQIGEWWKTHLLKQSEDMLEFSNNFKEIEEE